MKGNIVSTSIASSKSPVNSKVTYAGSEKLRFGKIVRSPIVAWGFDTATADLTPIPLAAGNYGRFVKNEHDSTWQFVQALPGNFEVSYVVDPKHLRAFYSRDPYLQKAAGVMYLGVDLGEDADEGYMDWAELALYYEEEYGPE